MSQFAPDLNVIVAHPSERASRELAALTAQDLAGADLVITTYGQVPRLPWLGEVEWNLLVLDEAQAIKNSGARQTRAVKELRSRGPYRPDRHAGREPAGRSLVAVRFPEPRACSAAPRRSRGVKRELAAGEIAATARSGRWCGPTSCGG